MKRAMLTIMLLTGGCTTGAFASRTTCDAGRAQMFVGTLGTADVGRVATQRARAKALRWIRPGMAVTMDYRTDRLNIEVDQRNFVLSIRCG